MKTVILKLTAAIVVAGQVVKPPAMVEVTEGEARDLLHRGKARIATEHDVEPVSARTLTEDAEPNPEVAAINADAAVRAAEDAVAPKTAKATKSINRTTN